MTENTGINTDFNLEDEYVPEPLVPQGTYHANVMEVSLDADRSALVWKLVLEGNDGFCSDGTTPVDGRTLYFRNWLPKPGDADEMASNGSMTKRQSKINMLARFADKMKINMNSPTAIAEAIADAEWIGKEVLAEVKIREFPQGSGEFNNDVSSMRAA